LNSLFQFSILNCFLPGAKKQPPIIGATCAFDAKIYKIVGGIFDVTSCCTGNKKNFQISDFCSALPSLLIAQRRKNSHWSIENSQLKRHRFWSIFRKKSKLVPAKACIAN
jgi:hypothetical protein